MCNTYSTPNNNGRDMTSSTEEGETNYYLALFQPNIKDNGGATASIAVISIAVACFLISVVFIYCLFRNCCSCCKRGSLESKWPESVAEIFREEFEKLKKEVHEMRDVEAAQPEIKEKYLEKKVDDVLKKHVEKKSVDLKCKIFKAVCCLLISFAIGMFIGIAILYVILHTIQPDQLSKKGNITNKFVNLGSMLVKKSHLFQNTLSPTHIKKPNKIWANFKSMYSL
jgi:hypothetical protein